MKTKKPTLTKKITALATVIVIVAILAACIVISTFSKKSAGDDDILLETTEKDAYDVADISDSESSDSQANGAESNDIGPYEQMVIDAGYGVVVALDATNYAVLTHGDHCVNGVHGSDILENYLSALGLQARTYTGGWISSANDWYWIIARDVSVIDNSGNEW